MIEDGEQESAAERFDRVVAPVEQRVRRALVARYGVDVGDDAASDAIAWAWEHVDRLAGATNPAGYLFRVGQSAARRRFRWRRPAPSFPREPADPELGSLDVDLFDALKQLKADQRVAVVMVHGYGFTYREVAEVLDTTETAVTNHVHRGLRRVREILGAER
jgi:RNA polymerase sigma factor (sigma-70 family)